MSSPTDLELMMYADGELTEPRSSEVARFLEASESSKEALQKLRGMTIVGDLVREHSARLATAHAADDIVSSVMKAIDAARLASQPASLSGAAQASSSATTSVVKTASEKAASEKAASVKAASVKAASVKAASVKEVKTASVDTSAIEGAKTPANDNNRFIYGLAGIAAAAAVALGMWGRNPPSPQATGREPVVREIPSMVAPNPSVAMVKRGSPDGAGPDTPSEAIPGEGDGPQDEPSVKVASVDFGAKVGTIYYVPKDTRGATTTVVWLADE